MPCDSTNGLDLDVFCECGQSLASHPALAKVRPWAGWRSERIDPEKAMAGRLASTHSVFRRRFSPNAPFFGPEPAMPMQAADEGSQR